MISPSRTGVCARRGVCAPPALVLHARNRYTFAALALLGGVLVAPVNRVVAAEATPRVEWNRETGQAVVVNGSLELLIETKPGLNACRLRDTRSEQVFADGDYCWSGEELPRLKKPPEIKRQPDGSCTIVFQGQLGSLEVEQTLTAPATEPGSLLEQITIRNPTDQPLTTADFQCGYAKCVQQEQAWTPDALEVRFCPVPYRRETDGKLREFPLNEVVRRGSTFGDWTSPAHPTATWGAEGWVWSKGTVALLIAKHNGEGMEWSLMTPRKRGAETLLQFGGAGQWKHGHPEGSTRLGPGQSFRFGETRLELVSGGWQPAFYAYRRWLERKGCGVRPDYNPPVHWNELYDTLYFSKVGEICFKPGFKEKNEKLLNEFYSLDLMKAEAAKAKDLGCEALYLDPGWDTGPSHHIWGESRLGTMDSFVKMLRSEYGLGLSLWIGVAGVPPTYADPEACPIEARVMDKDGKRTELHCIPSPVFLATKEQRLLELCRHGVAFLMFDSTQYTGPCYDPTHGHQVPSTREEHAWALVQLAQRVKQRYPSTLIEMHDPISGPSSAHYTPTCFGYARTNSFDCLWGHEFMWSSLDDLLSGRAVSLYYYNLAYSIPLYLHVSLKQDNEHALVFWWYASTCRHLGLGGKSEPKAWAAAKQAMQTYLSLKAFYTQGAFYGLEETVHAHTLSASRRSVINAFNLEDKPVQKTLRFRLPEIGLSAGAVSAEGASLRRDGEDVVLELDLPARGHRLVKLASP